MGQFFFRNKVACLIAMKLRIIYLHVSLSNCTFLCCDEQFTKSTESLRLKNNSLWRTIVDLHSFLSSFTDIEFLRDYHLMMSKNMAEVKELKKRRTWTLLRATDFELLVNPCFCICWLLGYLFYMFESSGYPLLKGCSAFSTSIMFIFVFSLLFTIYEINIDTRINY